MEDNKQVLVASQGEREILSPKQVEQYLLDEERRQFEEMSKMPPEELAAKMFGITFPQFEAFVSKLSGKQARKVLLNIVGFPMYDENPKFTDENAGHAFNLGTRCLQAKHVMINKLELDQMIEAESKVGSEQNSAKDNVDISTETLYNKEEGK